MNKQLIIPILVGILAGAGLFFIPFLVVRILVISLVITGLYRLFRARRYREATAFGLHPAFADTIRRMTEEEYQSFRQSLENPFRRYGNSAEPAQPNI